MIPRFHLSRTVLTLAVLAAAGTASAQSDCNPDLDGNGTIDAADLAMLLGAWGPCTAPPPPPPPQESVFLVIDSDSISNGDPPNFFSAVDVNDQLATVGLRATLPAFSGAKIGTQIELWTGTVGDEGFFALKSIPGLWNLAGPTTDGLQNFILAGPGLGSGPDPEILLDNVSSVTPLRATGLSQLKGKTVCAIVYDGDIAVNYNPLTASLKGANLGIVAFKVLQVTQLTGQSSGSLPKVLIEIVDPVAAFAGPMTFLSSAPEPISSSIPFDIVPTS